MHSIIKKGKPVFCALAMLDMDKIKICPIDNRIAKMKKEGKI